MSVLSRKAVETADTPALVAGLVRRLNRRAEPVVLVTVVDDLVCFRSDTWPSILLARVEDALDDLIGSAWRCGFSWT